MSNLIETLQEALACAIAREAALDRKHDDFVKVLQLLSTPDALAWVLLEEMAERVESYGFEHSTARTFHMPDHSAAAQAMHGGGVMTGHDYEATPERYLGKLLCVIAANKHDKARAIKEQEGRVGS